MTDKGYCTVSDVESVLQEVDLAAKHGGDDSQIVDAITAQSEWLQETTNRHWYETDPEDSLLYDAPLTHDKDVQDIPTKAAFALGEDLEARSTLQLFRRDITELTELLVIDDEGNYVDWVDSSDHTEGIGEDYTLLVDDADGWSDLVYDTDNLSDVDTFTRGVIATYEYGIEGITPTVRRGVAALATLILLADDEAALGIPDNGNLVPADSKISVIREEAERLLEIHEDTR